MLPHGSGLLFFNTLHWLRPVPAQIFLPGCVHVILASAEATIRLLGSIISNLQYIWILNSENIWEYYGRGTCPWDSIRYIFIYALCNILTLLAFIKAAIINIFILTKYHILSVITEHEITVTWLWNFNIFFSSIFGYTACNLTVWFDLEASFLMADIFRKKLC